MEEPEPHPTPSSSEEMEEGEIEDDLPTTTTTTTKEAERDGSPDSDIIIVEMDQVKKQPAPMPLHPPQQSSHRLPSQPPFLPYQHHPHHPPPPPPPPQHFFPPPQYSHPSPQFYPQLPPAPPLPPPEPVPVREIVAASTQVINQLLSFGVSPEYLVSYGVSKELVAIAFNELHYLLPTHLAHLAPPPGEGWKTPQEVFGGRAEKRPRSPEREEKKSNEVDLKEMEVRKRQELMARKAAIASRNSMKATALQNELDSLFAQKSSGPSAAALEAHPEDQDGIGHLRHAVTHTEQTVNTPPSGPFPSSRISSPSYQHRPYHGNGRANRPSAADFLGEEQTLVIELSDEEPSDEEEEAEADQPPNKKAKISPRATTSTTPFVSSPDSSDEEDEDAIVTASLLPPKPLRKNSSNSSTQPHPPSRTPSIPTPTPIASTSTSNSTSSSKTLAQQQLEVKEKEIKLVLERIKKMEERKKSKNASASMARSESNESGKEVKVEVEEAKEIVEELKKDREELLAVTEVEKEYAMAVEEKSFGRVGGITEKKIPTIAATIEISTPVPSTSSSPLLTPLDSTPSKPVCVPCNSLLTVTSHSSPSSPPQSLLNRLFQASRSRSSSPSAPSTSSAPTHLAFTQATPANYRSYIVKKKGLDTNKRLCKFEMDGEGKCADKSCKSLHFRDFEGEQQDLTDFLLLTIKLPPTSINGLHSAKDDEKDKILKRGLELVLNVKNVGVDGRTFAQAREVAVEFVEGMLAPRGQPQVLSSSSKA